ncbi:MAG: lipase secretion chaperone [Gammaproteobacteria bacterium]
MNRKVWGMTAAVAAVVILVIAAGWRASAPLPATASAEGGTFQTVAMSGAGMPGAMNAADEAGMSEQERHAARVSELAGQLAALQRSPGNLQAFLQALHRRCDSEASCAALLDEVLAQHPDRDFADLVARTVAKLPFYEREMQSLVMSMETPPRERYARVHELRERTLGAEEAALAFGQERAWAEYQFAFGDLQSRAAGMTAQQRLEALNALRGQSFGSHAEALRAVEGPAGAYEREVALLLVGVEDAAQRALLTEQARRRHFDADTVVQMAARDTQLASQQKQVGDFKADAARLRHDLEPLRATMNPAAWDALHEQRMTELRLRHFPPETP